MTNSLSQDYVLETRKQLQQVSEYFQKTIAKLRTGRAHPSLIEDTAVVSYGSKYSLKQLATIVTGEASQLLVTPYDPSLSGAIEQGLKTSGLGLRTIPMGGTIRVILPPLTEERRRELVKILKKELEQATVAARSVRRAMNDRLDRAKQDKQLSQDEHRSAAKRLEENCEACYADLRNAFKVKESEILTI